MKHITEEYGQETNLLELTGDELEALEPFLRKLGVRCRGTKWHYQEGKRIVTIQADNPYLNYYELGADRTYPDRDMTDEAIAWYKR